MSGSVGALRPSVRSHRGRVRGVITQPVSTRPIGGAAQVSSRCASWFSPPPPRRPASYGHGFEMFCLASDGGTVVASACKVGVANAVNADELSLRDSRSFVLRSALPGGQSRARSRAAVERRHLEAAAGAALPRPHRHPDGLLPGRSPPAGRVTRPHLVPVAPGHTHRRQHR